MCNDWFYLFHFLSERRRASGGLSLEELRRNMQFSPIDRNGVFADNMYTDTVQTVKRWVSVTDLFLFFFRVRVWSHEHYEILLVFQQ